MPKSATTDLWESISTHPHVIPGLLKEYHWWNRLIFGKRRTTCVHVIFSCNASIHIWTIYNIDSDSSISSYIDLFDAAADRINRTCAHNATHNNPCITGLPLLRWKLPNPDCLVLFFFGTEGDATTSMMWDSLNYRENETEPGIRFPVDAEDMAAGILHKVQPKAKIIVILRDPIQR